MQVETTRRAIAARLKTERRLHGLPVIWPERESGKTRTCVVYAWELPFGVRVTAFVPRGKKRKETSAQMVLADNNNNVLYEDYTVPEFA